MRCASGFTYFSCKDTPLSGQIVLSLITDGVIELTLITTQQVGFLSEYLLAKAMKIQVFSFFKSQT